LDKCLLIFVNGIIQEPGVAYEFEGGTSFRFTTPPKKEDNVAVFFYRGTKGSGGDSDVDTSTDQSLKEGDTVQVLKNNAVPGTITQNQRTITNLRFSDKFETDLYSDQGVDTINYKPLNWLKQKADKVVNGQIVYKSRDSIETQVYPTANIIRNFSSTEVNEIFVDNAEFFNYGDAATEGFNALIINGISITADSSVELIKNINFINGFSGIITGITTTAGIGTSLAIKFFLNTNAESFNSLNVGYPIYIFDTQVGSGVTSITNSNSNIVGIGTSFLDNIYHISQINRNAENANIICNVHSSSPIIGIQTTGSIQNPLGKFSWGRLCNLDVGGFTRSSSRISIGVSGNTVTTGLTTFPTIQRRGGFGLRDTGALYKGNII
jgi:hypothetical protein